MSGSPYEVEVLFNGYSRKEGDHHVANCTCTLIMGPVNTIVDTMTPWDADKLIAGLKTHNVNCSDVGYVICTHGHSDHVGNNNLFTNAVWQLVGFDMSLRQTYYDCGFETGKAFKIDDYLSIIPTPGHTAADVTVLVKTCSRGVVAITGDLFESEADLDDPTIWQSVGYEPLRLSQEKHRNDIIRRSDYIVPGHGPMFQVTDAMRKAVTWDVQ